MNNYTQKLSGVELNSSSQNLQSTTIDVLRFPLAIMVIFIHMNPNVVNLLDADFCFLSGQGVYNVTGIIFSHVLTHIAVPVFYFISGLLFFLNFNVWTWKGYKGKLKSRVNTLLVPYVLWNLIPFILIVFGYAIVGRSVTEIFSFIQEKSWHVLYDYHEWGTTRTNWLGESLRMTGPFDLPLWFLRDLIVVTILTPLIYFLIRRLKIFIVLLLFIAYVSRIWTLVPGFHITAFFYFSLGAYFALNRIDVVSFVNKYRIIIIPVSIVLLIIATIYDGTNTVFGQNVYPFFIFFGVFAAFYVTSFCVRKFDIVPNKFLVSTCFFVYAFHGAPIPYVSPLSLSRRLLCFFIPGESILKDYACYIASPFLAAAVCIFVLVIAKRIVPKIALMFSGNK